MSESEEKVPSLLEKHVVTILVSLITIGIGYMVSEQVSNTRATEVTKIQMNFLIEQVTQLRSDVRKLELNYVRVEQFIDHETRLRSLEGVKK